MKKIISSVVLMTASLSVAYGQSKAIAIHRTFDEISDQQFGSEPNEPVKMDQGAFMNYSNTGKNLVYNTGNLLVKIDETIRHIPEATDEKLADFSKCVAVTHASLFRKDSRGEAQAARGQEPVKAVFCSMELGGSVLTAFVDDMAKGTVKIVSVPLKAANDMGISLMSDAKEYLKSRGGDSKGTIGSIVDWIPGSSLVEVGSAGVVFVAGASLWMTSNTVKFLADETVKGYELLVDGADGFVHTGIVVAKNTTIVIADISVEVGEGLKERGIMAAKDSEGMLKSSGKAVLGVIKLPAKALEFIVDGIAYIFGEDDAAQNLQQDTNGLKVTFGKVVSNTGKVLLGIVTFPGRLPLGQRLDDLLAEMDRQANVPNMTYETDTPRM